MPTSPTPKPTLSARLPLMWWSSQETRQPTRQATRVDTAGNYTYVIGTEAQLAAIAQVPDVTFLPFSTSQATSVYLLLLRDLLVSSQFTYSVQNITTTLSPAAALAAMGLYYPTVSTCPLATLAAKGVQGC
jgi:hypothetical protein